MLIDRRTLLGGPLYALCLIFAVPATAVELPGINPPRPGLDQKPAPPAVAEKLPIITGFDQACISPGGEVSIQGRAFGTARGSRRIKLGSSTVPVKSWSDRRIVVQSGAAIDPGARYDVRIVDGARNLASKAISACAAAARAGRARAESPPKAVVPGSRAAPGPAASAPSLDKLPAPPSWDLQLRINNVSTGESASGEPLHWLHLSGRVINTAGPIGPGSGYEARLLAYESGALSPTLITRLPVRNLGSRQALAIDGKSRGIPSGEDFLPRFELAVVATQSGRVLARFQVSPQQVRSALARHAPMALAKRIPNPVEGGVPPRGEIPQSDAPGAKPLSSFGIRVPKPGQLARTPGASATKPTLSPAKPPALKPGSDPATRDHSLSESHPDFEIVDIPGTVIRDRKFVFSWKEKQGQALPAGTLPYYVKLSSFSVVHVGSIDVNAGQKAGIEQVEVPEAFLADAGPLVEVSVTLQPRPRGDGSTFHDEVNVYNNSMVKMMRVAGRTGAEDYPPRIHGFRLTGSVGTVRDFEIRYSLPGDAAGQMELYWTDRDHLPLSITCDGSDNPVSQVAVRPGLNRVHHAACRYPGEEQLAVANLTALLRDSDGVELDRQSSVGHQWNPGDGAAYQDLAVSIQSAHVGSRANTVEVAVRNLGTAESVPARLSLAVTPEFDRVCQWPTGDREVPPIGPGGARTVTFMTEVGPSENCQDFSRPQPDRSAIRLLASLRPGFGSNDFSRHNNVHHQTLDNVLDAPETQTAVGRSRLMGSGSLGDRSARAEIVPPGARAYRMRVSNLHMKVRGTGDSDAFRSVENQHDAGELRWVEFQIGPYAPTRIGLDRLAVVGEARRHHGAYLSIRRFDTLQVTGGISLEATVAEGVQVDLITRARELDCSGDRVCNRGTGGTVEQTITVPRFAANFTGNCAGRRYRLGDLTDDRAGRDSRLGVREGQLAIEPLHDWVMVCFEPVER